MQRGTTQKVNLGKIYERTLLPARKDHYFQNWGGRRGDILTKREDPGRKRLCHTQGRKNSGVFLKRGERGKGQGKKKMNLGGREKKKAGEENQTMIGGTELCPPAPLPWRRKA